MKSTSLEMKMILCIRFPHPLETPNPLNKEITLLCSKRKKESKRKKLSYGWSLYYWKGYKTYVIVFFFWLLQKQNMRYGS